MRKTGIAAALYMGSLARNKATGVKGYCLRTCRLAWGLPADDVSAIKEWESIPVKNRHTNPNTAPVGAPHFWKGGKFGHVAIQAEHEGYVWTTDLPEVNKVGLVDIKFINRKWGYTYLGWSDVFQGAKLPLGAEAPKL